MSSSASEIQQHSSRTDNKSKGKSRTADKTAASKFKQDPKKKSLHHSKNDSLKSSSGKTTSEEGGRRRHGRSKESKDLVKSMILQSIEKTGGTSATGKETPASGATILYKVSGDKLSFASFDPYYPTIGARRTRKKPFLPAVQEARLSAHKKHRLINTADAVQKNQRVIVKNEAFKLNELLKESTEEVEFSSALFEDSFDDIARKNEQALRQKLKKDLKGKKSLKKETEEKVEAQPEEKPKPDEKEPSLVPSKKITEDAKSKETSKQTSKETQEVSKTVTTSEKDSSQKTEETKEVGIPGSTKKELKESKGALAESLAKSEAQEGPAKKASEKTTSKAPEKTTSKAPEKTSSKAPEKTSSKVPEKTSAKALEKTFAKAPVKTSVKASTPVSETLSYGERKEIGGSISAEASDVTSKPGKSPSADRAMSKDLSRKPGSLHGVSAGPVATSEARKRTEAKPGEKPRSRAAPTSSGEPAEQSEEPYAKKPYTERGTLAKKESSQLFFVPKKKSQERLPTVKRSKRMSKHASPFSPYYIRPAEGSVSSSSVTSDERGRPHPSGLSFSSFCFLYQHYQAVNEEIACCCETKLSLAELQSRSCRELCERDVDRRHVHHPTGLTFSEYRVVMS